MPSSPFFMTPTATPTKSSANTASLPQAMEPSSPTSPAHSRTASSVFSNVTDASTAIGISSSPPSSGVFSKLSSSPSPFAALTSFGGGIGASPKSVGAGDGTGGFLDRPMRVRSHSIKVEHLPTLNGLVGRGDSPLTPTTPRAAGMEDELRTPTTPMSATTPRPFGTRARSMSVSAKLLGDDYNKTRDRTMELYMTHPENFSAIPWSM